MKQKIFLLLLFIITSSVAQNKNKTIGFKENKGQIIDQKGKSNNAVKYLLNSGGLNVQLKKNGFSYDIYEAKKHPINHSRGEKSKPLPFPSKDNEKLPDYNLEYQYHRIDIDFLNSNSKVELITEEKSLDYDNYYNIPNKPEGVLMVYQYKQITYKNIYPNIDVIFSVPKDTLKTVEYNFVVHPKGKISDIQLKFSGAQTELVDNKIRMTVRFGEMEETLPASWTEDGELKKEITVGYTKIKKNVYGFASTENVSDKTVIIDPVPVRLWGTFYGDESGNSSSASWWGIDLTTDSLGNAYVSGSTTSMSPSYATSGAHQTTVNSIYVNSITNGIIFKFDSNGNRLWGTYYTGTQAVYICGIKIDSQNNVLVTGYTWSETHISTLGSFQPNLKGSSDAFLVKFNSNGVRQWGTYFGGKDIDYASDLDIDSNDNIYIVGTTSSKTNIAIKSNFQTELSNSPKPYGINTDAFITKFNDNGNLIWSTYVGGDGNDNLKAVVIKNSYLVAGGYTESTNNMATPGVFQELPNPLYPAEGYICKFSLDGERAWGSYYGGSSPMENIESVEIDDEENIYIGGYSYSSDNIATPGTFETSNSNLYKGFLAKLSSQGQRIWGTYIGDISISSIVFQNNSIYLGGGNIDFRTDYKLTTPCSYKPDRIRSFYGYAGKFSKEGLFIWGTYIGNNDTLKIALDSDGAIFVAGLSSFNDDIADGSSYQSNILGEKNYFLMKFSEDLTIKIPQVSSNSPICIGTDLKLEASGGTNYSWTGPNGFTSTDQNPTIPNATAINNGQYSCNITGTGGCDGVYTIDVIVGDTVAPIPEISNLPTITGDCQTSITTIPTATDACSGTITATTASPLSYSLPGTYTVVWDYDDGNNNISHQNQTVTISNQPLPTANSPETFCIQQNATINNIVITGQNIKWSDALTGGNLLINTTPLQNGNTYYASQTINGCESERTPLHINIQNTLAPTGSIKQSFCTGQNPTLSTITVVGSAIKWYDSPTQGNLLADTTPLVDGKTYYATQTVNNCESTNRLAITVSLISSLPANDYDFSICDDLNDGKEIIKLEDYNSYLISNTTNYNFSYYKSLSDAENEVTGNKIITFSNYKLALGENKIYVRINSNTPCYAIVVLKITLLPKPVIPIQDIVPICENKSIIIDAGSGADNYLWSNGATTQTITVNNPGDLSVTVTRNYGTISCSSDKSFAVKTSNIAKISSIETKDWTDNDNTITVFVTGLGDYEYSIDGANYQSSNLFSGVNSGEYMVRVRDKNGCGSASEEVYLLMYPKFFTPNGDGYNDIWKIKSSDTEKSLTLKIFDRFGKLLKELDSYSNGWDGTYTGQPLPATDYWFVVTRENGKEYRGHFSLKR
jgi:gliding motility-associated-like protein